MGMDGMIGMNWYDWYLLAVNTEIYFQSCLAKLSLSKVYIFSFRLKQKEKRLERKWQTFKHTLDIRLEVLIDTS